MPTIAGHDLNVAGYAGFLQFDAGASAAHAAAC